MDSFENNNNNNNSSSSSSSNNISNNIKQYTTRTAIEQAPSTSTTTNSDTTQQPLYQDTNYVGITITDDIPKYNSNNVTRHQSLSGYPLPNKLNQSRHSSIPQLPKPTPPIYQTPRSVPATAATTSNVNHIRYGSNQVILEEDSIASNDFVVQKEMSGAFLRIRTQADLPMSHHRRAREGKRYGVSECSLLHIGFTKTIRIATVHAYLRTKSYVLSL